MIREIKPSDSFGTDIVLNINDKLLESSDDKLNDVSLINEIIEKLTSSLEQVNSIIFKPCKVSWWHYNTVRLTAESKRLIEQIKSPDPLGKPFLEKLSQQLTASADTIHSRYGEINLHSGEINDKLNRWISKNDLLKSGDFVIFQDKHARDWIDTSKLLENNEYLGHIVKNFLEILYSDNLKPDNTILIGDGFPGLIIASQLGFIGGYGCTYLAQFENINDDITVSIPIESNIAIVTDVVAEGETLRKSLDRLNSKIENATERIKKVLTVFYRKPIGSDINIDEDTREILISLNNDYPIQLCGKNPADCIFYKDKSVEIINDELNQFIK